jgi:hypothetical protein
MCPAGRDKPYPPLQVLRYLEEYPRAIADLQVAEAVDPSLGAAGVIRDIVDFVERMAGLVSSKVQASLPFLYAGLHQTETPPFAYCAIGAARRFRCAHAFAHCL